MYELLSRKIKDDLNNNEKNNENDVVIDGCMGILHYIIKIICTYLMVMKKKNRYKYYIIMYNYYLVVLDPNYWNNKWFS